MKELMILSSKKVQQSGTNFFTTIPSTIRDLLKLEKGDEIQFYVYSDKTIEIKCVKVGVKNA